MAASLYPQVSLTAADLSKEEDTEHVISDTIRQHGKLDILVRVYYP